MLLRLLLAALLCLPSAVRAEWSEAESKHFIVYSEAPQAEVRQAAEEGSLETPEDEDVPVFDQADRSERI